MTLPLPDCPSLHQLKIQAKELLVKIRAADPSAKLAHAQALVARQYGFANWQTLHAHIDELTDLKLQNLSETFRKFAARECHGSSPLYECFASKIADDPELLHLAAFGRAPIPNLLLAAVHLLVLADPACDLARHYASVDASPLPAESGWIKFRDFCLANRQAIIRLMRARTTQTNEIRRSAYLAAAFNLVWKKGSNKPLALVEIGASAGLNLCFDHFAFKLNGVLLGDRASPLVLEIEPRGNIAPPMPETPIPIAHRIGIDLHPIGPDNIEGIEWLSALVWPEHSGRRLELAAALQIVKAVPLQLIASDAVSILGSILSHLPTDCTICVFQTHSFNQIPMPGRQQLQATMREIGKSRPIYFISRHDHLTLDVFTDSPQEPTTVLAETDGHGRWIEWLI